jgi:CheY-like chemotaxis protein
MKTRDSSGGYRFLPAFLQPRTANLSSRPGMETALCLDDDPLSLRLVEHLLKKRFRVVSCPSIDRAIEAVRREVIEVFLCDYHLGQEFTGAQAYEILRIKHGYDPLHRILITSYPSPEIEAETLACGFDRVFSKPLRKEFQAYCLNLRSPGPARNMRTG